MRLKVAFVVTSIGTGGAESMLLRLVAAMDKNRFDPTVIVLSDRTPLADRLEQAGATVHSLASGRVLWRLRALVALFRIVKRLRPNVVQGWMVHGNLGAALLRTCLGIPVIWGVRHSRLLRAREKASTRLLTYLMKYASFLPARIVYNSEEGKLHHEALGYNATRSVVIPNGFDLSHFSIDTHARSRFRTEYRFPTDCAVIGMVARYHPMKDHQTFLKAAAILHRQCPGIRFVLVGRGCEDTNSVLVQTVTKYGLAHSCLLLGEQSDIQYVANGFDIGASSSISEAFPNAIGEMMACGVPCVVTDVGDSNFLVGDTGMCVPPSDPHALAHAWQRMIEIGPDGRRNLGMKARARILELFSIRSVAERFEQLYLHPHAKEH